MNQAVEQLFTAYLRLVDGDKPAAANLVLADTLREYQPASSQPLDKPMTVPEVSRLLRVTQNKILRWIHRGELPATNVATRNAGRPRYRISHADLATFQQHRASLTTQSVGTQRVIRRSPMRPFPKPRHPTT